MTPAIARTLLTPETPVRYLRGVGESRGALFSAAGIDTIEDLLYFFPHRYEDRRHPVRICDLSRIDAPVTLRGRVVSSGRKTSPVKRLKIFEAILDDGTGRIMLVWFNQPYLAEQIGKDTQLVIYGQPRVNHYGRLQIESPDFEKIGPDGEAEDEGTIVPIYSRVSGIPPRAVRRIVQQALECIAELEDPLPAEIRRTLGVLDLRTALIHLHHPPEIDESFLAGRSPAHRRMILQEFFGFQLALRVKRATEESTSKSRRISIDDGLRNSVRKVLPFSLTRAQKRVLKEIAGDLCLARPMYRLLQGDVGSGKTIVALISAMIVIRNGHQAALLAPTEILAEQHYQRILQLVEGADLRVAKLTAAVKGSERKTLLESLRAGEIDLLVGTHALLEKPVEFRSFGLAIVDEQHRFGVAQRQRLFEKGDDPDILVMTATPIPRSLAIAMYGDLELSVIDELPPGRQPVKTVVRGTAKVPSIHAFVAGEIASGAQAYVVYPLIDESEKLDVKALTAGAESIRDAFPQARIAVLHGRMTADEKRETMLDFRRHAVDILVSTTIIEVGIDVPNASIMMIMDADRFGLSQLHQLRGRVGRGKRRSYCILLRDETTSEEAKERLRSFEKTRDGFEVAEADLRMRGAGDFFGTRQSGVPRFRFGDILRDHALMETARDLAIEVLAGSGLTEARAIASRLTPPEWSSPSSRD